MFTLAARKHKRVEFLNRYEFSTMMCFYGDRQHHFKAHSRQVGDFVFLRIRQKDRMDTETRNRELKDHYDFLVKATCRQKEAGNLEATAKVRLTITDRNDAMPIFTLEADQYEATISDQTAPFTDVIRVEASDADEGINGQIYYSLVNRSADFTVDPISGWIRTLRHLRSGVYQLKVRSEDRTSRLFYNDPDQIQPAWSKDVVITVTESKRRHLKLLVANKPINGYRSDVQQLASCNNPGRYSVKRGIDKWTNSLESGNLEWQLYTVPGRFIPSKTNVTISAGQESISSGMVNTTANIKIEVGEPHSIVFDDAAATFHVNESAPLGYLAGFGGQSSIVVTVSIKDSNDHSPVWLPSGVAKAQWLFLMVDAVDLDSGENARIGYKLSSDSQVPFAVNFETGEISLSAPLKAGDNEWSVAVWAVDAGRPLPRSTVLNLVFYRNGTKVRQSYCGFSLLNVQVPAKPKPVIGAEPVNKHEPVFEDFHGPVEIEEDVAIGT
ncbi:cadherin domain protein, partial [Ostertagia ostertagi]